MQDFHETWIGRAAKGFGPALFVISLVAYLLLLAPGAFPGEPAKLVAQHAGLEPFPPMTNLLWHRVVQFLALFPFAGLVWRLNVFSALCGAGAVWLTYALVSRIPHNRTAEEVESKVPMGPVQAFSGLVAGLFLAFCLPFWVVSTRAHPAAFDLFLFLLAAYVLVRFSEEKSPALMYLYAFLYGLGMAEFATFIVWAPLFGLWFLFALWRAQRLQAGTLLRLALCWLGGQALYLAAALDYRLSPAYQWREFTSIGQVLWFFWRDQWLAIRYSLPQVGWIMVFMVCLFPALVVVFPKKAMTRTAVWSSNLLHLVMTFVGALVLYNTPFSPWGLFGAHPLLVTPYWIVAVWTGYIGGYWLVYFSPYSSFASQRSLLRKVGRQAMPPVFLAALAVAAVRNIPQANGRAGEALRALAGQVVDGLEGKKWLITNGALDDLIRIAARERGVSVKILNVGWGRATAYLNYAASLMDTPRLKGLALVGLSPLLQEWFTQTTHIEHEVTVLALSDLWIASGRVPVPEGMLFNGAGDVSGIEAESYAKRQQAFWSAFRDTLPPPGRAATVAAPWLDWAAAYVSRSANNAGVLLEELKRPDLAYEAYRAAMQLNTNNASALLNSLVLAKAGDKPELKALESDLDAYARGRRRRLPLWALASQYGYVRNPEVYASRGMAWALSGKSDLAVAELKKAVELGGPREQFSLAQVLEMQQMDAESEEIYTAVLQKHPEHAGSLLGMVRLSLRKGDLDAAEGYLDRLRQTTISPVLLKLEEAMLDGLRGRTAEAKDKLQAVVKEDVQNSRAWIMLAVLAQQENDAAMVEKSLSALNQLAARIPALRITLAQLAMQRRDVPAARAQLDDILKARPNNIQALEMSLQLDLVENKRVEMEERAQQLLNIDPRNALGNYVYGLILFSRGAYEMAEASFRASLLGRKTPGVLNDLAWILTLRGRYDEAQKFVRESLALDPNNPIAWDTLGVLQLRQNRIAEAQEALQKALALLPTHPHMVLHMAEVYEKQGLRPEALQLAEPLIARANEMSPDAYEDLRRLINRLRR